MSAPYRLSASLLALLMASAAFGPPAVADDWRSELDLRYRLERVEQGNFERNATASTLRARLEIGTPSWRGVDALAGFHVNRVMGERRFNDTTGNGGYPVVADPADSGLAQSWLRYRAEELPFEAVAGRQRVVLDDARFVGNVGFRQLEQTYDALRTTFEPGEEWTVDLIHIDRAHRIFGPNHPAPGMASTDLNARVASVSREIEDHRMSAYLHRFGNEDQRAASFANEGIRLEGPVGPLRYLAEFAQQSGHRGGGPEDPQEYIHFRFSGELGEGRWHAGHERLGGDGEDAFQTPFATLHAFNGWSDRFLTTPATGLQDTYAGLQPAMPGRWQLTTRLHDFRADSGGATYGRELNLALARPLGLGWQMELKGARYQARDLGDDTTKLWLTLSNRWQGSAMQ